MNKLNQFNEFNSSKFFKGKKLVYLSQTKASDNGEVVTRCEIVIARDATEYVLSDDEKDVSNLYEKFKVRVYGKDISIPSGTEVSLINPVCRIYGEYRNQLSVTADDIVPVTK